MIELCCRRTHFSYAEKHEKGIERLSLLQRWGGPAQAEVQCGLQLLIPTAN